VRHAAGEDRHNPCVTEDVLATDAAEGWVVRPPARLDAGRHCTLCGRLLPRRSWVTHVDGAERDFCEPDCADLYRTYWLPRYGGSAGR
jgi:hypothetical protein